MPPKQLAEVITIHVRSPSRTGQIATIVTHECRDVSAFPLGNSTFFGGSSGDALRSIAVAPGNRLLAGGTSSSSNVPVAHAPQPGRAGADDGLWVLVQVP